MLTSWIGYANDDLPIVKETWDQLPWGTTSLWPLTTCEHQQGWPIWTYWKILYVGLQIGCQHYYHLALLTHHLTNESLFPQEYYCIVVHCWLSCPSEHTNNTLWWGYCCLLPLKVSCLALLDSFSWTTLDGIYCHLILSFPLQVNLIVVDTIY